MKQSDDNKFIPMTSISGGKGVEVRKDVYYYTNQIVNIVFIGDPNKDNWVLVDAGMPKCAKEIIEVAEKRFGENSKPGAIILTHGHFDHVGSIVDLIKHWNVPVFAHMLEYPFLSGQKNYSEPDTNAEGGLSAKISSIFPNEPIDIAEALRPLKPEGTLPFLADWKWIHTPGHSPGHISLFREKDRTLIAGDAFVTVKQDSLYKVLIQKEEVHGPPVCLTTDWLAAWNSVMKLEELKPEVAITGHGTFMQSDELRRGLRSLALEFDTRTIPDHGNSLIKNTD